MSECSSYVQLVSESVGTPMAALSMFIIQRQLSHFMVVVTYSCIMDMSRTISQREGALIANSQGIMIVMVKPLKL